MIQGFSFSILTDDQLDLSGFSFSSLNFEKMNFPPGTDVTQLPSGLSSFSLINPKTKEINYFSGRSSYSFPLLRGGNPVTWPENRVSRYQHIGSRFSNFFHLRVVDFLELCVRSFPSKYYYFLEKDRMRLVSG